MLKACYLRLNGIDKEVDQKYLYSVKGLRYLLTFRRHVCTIGLRSPLPRGSYCETTWLDGEPRGTIYIWGELREQGLG